MRVICIIGLPSSGKTTYMNNLLITEVDIFDDVSVGKGPSDFMEYLTGCDGEHVTAMVTDVALCVQATRDDFEYCVKSLHPLAMFKYICFENDPKQCLINAKNRNDGREVENTIRSMAKVYTYPEGAEIIPVWKPNV